MFDLSVRNPLVNIKPNRLWWVDVNDENAPKIYKKQQYFLKEYALQTSLLVTHFIKWKHPKKDKFYTSPLFITPVKVNKNQKIELRFQYETLNDQYTINPVIKNVFKTIFNVDFNTNQPINERIDFLVQSLETNGNKVSFVDGFTDIEQWEIITLKAVGTFNYKKAILAQDYAQLIKHPNQSLQILLGEQQPIFSQNNLIDVVNLNPSQTKAVSESLVNNTVIQGPPGTGKSNTIVELIKQCLLNQKKVLFVSEKKSALDVVYQKLSNDGLSQLLAYFDGSKQQKKQFYGLLKSSIKLIQEVTPPVNLKNVSKQIDDINNWFDAYLSLSQVNTQQSVSGKMLFDEIISENYKNTPSTITSVPPYQVWNKYLQFLEELEDLSILTFKNKTLKQPVKTLSELSFIHLNRAVFTQNHPLDLLNKRLTELKSVLKTFTELDAVYNLNWSWEDLSKHSVASSILQMANLSQLDILDPYSKKYKSFNTWTKKYELLKHKINISQKLIDNWSIKPKFNQIDDLIDELTQSKSNIFSIFQSSNVKKVFKHYNKPISPMQKIKVLKHLKQHYQLTFDLEEITIKLKHNLGILNPDVEINQLMAMRKKLESNSHQQYVFLLEHPQSLQLIEDLHQLQPKIQQANQIKRFLFNQFTPTSIDNLNNLIKQIEADLPHYNYYLPEIKKLLSLPPNIINFIKQNPKKIKQLTETVVFNTLNQLLKFEPHLKQLTGQQVLEKFNELKQLKTIKNKQITQQIVFNQQKRWQMNQQLILTSSTKLKTEQKQLKKDVKKSKRIIFHETAKQQQHLPVKSLIEQTSNLLFDIVPVWMMNPLSIAESLPCKANMFDVVIFDEASQIPLEDSLPAVYRGKHIVVVGDSKQMPPSQFFSSQNETVSLLMEADVNLASILLKTHYRSHHPKLMEFSNLNFYDNELNYFPPATVEPPLILNYIKQGKFENGKNIIEAKSVANTYHQHLKNGKKEVGIIAFSVEQEQEIIKQINALHLPQNNRLLIRNLENAQGIEKDYIIISIGYGFNNEGKFKQQFGPLNNTYGANRLNVLLTRAKKQITVCTSIKSTDFKLTENIGVQLLKDYLAFVEQNNQLVTTQPQHYLHHKIDGWLKSNPATQQLNIKYHQAINGQMINAFIDENSQNILLIDPCLNNNETQNIYTLLDVLQQRFSKVKVVLSKNYIDNPTRFKTEIIDCFV